MLQHPLNRGSQKSNDAIVPKEDPWKAHTTLYDHPQELLDEIDLSDLPIQEELGFLGEAELAALLPQPLQENYELSTCYVRLIELARHAQRSAVNAVAATLEAAAEELGDLHHGFSRAVHILAQVMESDLTNESHLLEQFHKLQEVFEALPSKDRGLLIATLQEVSDTLMPLAGDKGFIV